MEKWIFLILLCISTCSNVKKPKFYPYQSPLIDIDCLLKDFEEVNKYTDKLIGESKAIELLGKEYWKIKKKLIDSNKDPNSLMALLFFESAGTLNPNILGPKVNGRVFAGGICQLSVVALRNIGRVYRPMRISFVKFLDLPPHKQIDYMLAYMHIVNMEAKRKGNTIDYSKPENVYLSWFYPKMPINGIYKGRIGGSKVAKYNPVFREKRKNSPNYGYCTTWVMKRKLYNFTKNL